VEIQNKKEVSLIRRSARERWNTPPQVRQQVVAGLLDLLRADPTVAVEISKAFTAMDMADAARDAVEIKREMVELKKAGDDNAIRLRLLELARHIEPTELARLASENGVTT
jgi:hypothetical protein